MNLYIDGGYIGYCNFGSGTTNAGCTVGNNYRGYGSHTYYAYASHSIYGGGYSNTNSFNIRCGSNSDCSGGQVCNTGTGQCVTPACYSNSDCGGTTYGSCTQTGGTCSTQGTQSVTNRICNSPGTPDAYCSSSSSSQSCYSGDTNGRACGTQDCDYLDTACRNYNDVSQTCSGGSCASSSCNSYSNAGAGTACGGGNICDGAGNCVSPDSSPPSVSSSANPTTANYGQTITFSVSSSDAESAVTNSRVYVDGTQRNSCSSSSCSWPSSSLSPGGHSYYGTATSTGGTSTSGTQTVNVLCTSSSQCGASTPYCVSGACVSDTTPPTARLVVTPNQTDIYDTTQPTYDASSSSDNSGVTGYRYDYNGDGTWDTGYLASSSRPYRLTQKGSYNVRVEVRDAAGNVAIATARVTVSSCSPVNCTRVNSTLTEKHGQTGQETIYDVTITNDDEYRDHSRTVYLLNKDQYTTGPYSVYGTWLFYFYDGGQAKAEVPLTMNSIEKGSNAKVLTFGVTPPRRAPPAPDNKPYVFTIALK